MGALLAEEPRAVLVIAGTGSLRERLRAEAENAGIGRSVVFAGAVEDIASFLGELDLFVLPSLWEGLPLTILEAMAASVPIVATAVDGTAEAVRHEREALLVPPGDAPALAAACLAARNDREGRMKRAAAAAERVARSFSLETMIDRYREVYAP